MIAEFIVRHNKGPLDVHPRIDGSDHRWFEDRAPACTLLAYVDDATSRLTMLHFMRTGSTFSDFDASRCRC